MDLKEKVRSIEGFPHEGITFLDITTVLSDKDALKESIDQMNDLIGDIDYDVVIGPESRGFIFGMPIAYNNNKSFVPIRKKGKLPYKTIEASYELEYGTATMEMHIDALKKGDKVIITDDLLATGGTCLAMIELIEKAGAEVVGLVFFIELEFLHGRDKLSNYNVQSVLKYN